MSPKPTKASLHGEFMKKLRLDGRIDDPESTVILRSSALRRRRSSRHAFPVSIRPRSSDTGIRSAEVTSPTQCASPTFPSSPSFETSLSPSPGTIRIPQRRISRRILRGKQSPVPLQTISESRASSAATFLTAEMAAAAKIFLETYWEEVSHGRPTARNVRKHMTEVQLCHCPHFTAEMKNGVRRVFYKQETNYLRESRVMKSTSNKRRTYQGDVSWHNYEPIKVLGKGSFGVVRLVCEKTKLPTSTSRRVFAMKVIRKSDMLLTGQEGHLRAERDFLVASEGEE